MAEKFIQKASKKPEALRKSKSPSKHGIKSMDDLMKYRKKKYGM